MEKSNFNCPVCTIPMIVVNGTQINHADGITVVCTNAACASNENVYGHGSNEKNAYEIACQKFGKKASAVK